MTKFLMMAALLTVGSFASAAQIVSYPINNVTISYEPQTATVFASGALISGQVVKNSLSSVTINTEITGKFEIDENNLVRLAMPTSGAFLVGFVTKSNDVKLDVPYQAYQVSERYDAMEKSMGAVDVDYITLDIKL